MKLIIYINSMDHITGLYSRGGILVFRMIEILNGIRKSEFMDLCNNNFKVLKSINKNIDIFIVKITSFA